MPKILERLVSQLKSKGHDEKSAYAIATAAMEKSGNIDRHGRATMKGIRRGNMSPAQRAIDRESKRSGRSQDDYRYNPKTNRATLKHGR